MAENRGKLPTWTKFVVGAFGGATGWLPIHPMDVLKVRAQINEGAAVNPVRVAANIVKEEGPKGLYAGLSAAMTRQFTYGTARLGLYDVLRDWAAGDADDIAAWKKALCGITAGGTAAALCNPVEVALVRMQADGAKPLAERRNYRHIFDAWVRVVREEGFMTLYTGVVPTVTRGMVVSMTQLATYDQAKTVVGSMGVAPGMATHFTASLISGLIYCWASLPLDVCKSRIQNQKTKVLKGVFHALYIIPKNEGIMALWKGFLPYYARGGGHTIFMFLAKEQYTNLAYWSLEQKQPV